MAATKLSYFCRSFSAGSSGTSLCPVSELPTPTTPSFIICRREYFFRCCFCFLVAVFLRIFFPFPVFIRCFFFSNVFPIFVFYSSFPDFCFLHFFCGSWLFYVRSYEHSVITANTTQNNAKSSVLHIAAKQVRAGQSATTQASRHEFWRDPVRRRARITGVRLARAVWPISTVTLTISVLIRPATLLTRPTHRTLSPRGGIIASNTNLTVFRLTASAPPTNPLGFTTVPNSEAFCNRHPATANQRIRLNSR